MVTQHYVPLRHDGDALRVRQVGEREGARRVSDGKGEVVLAANATRTHLTRSRGPGGFAPGKKMGRSHPLPPQAGGEGQLDPIAL